MREHGAGDGLGNGRRPDPRDRLVLVHPVAEVGDDFLDDAADRRGDAGEPVLVVDNLRQAIDPVGHLVANGQGGTDPDQCGGILGRQPYFHALAWFQVGGDLRLADPAFILVHAVPGTKRSLVSGVVGSYLRRRILLLLLFGGALGRRVVGRGRPAAAREQPGHEQCQQAAPGLAGVGEERDDHGNDEPFIAWWWWRRFPSRPGRG